MLHGPLGGWINFWIYFFCSWSSPSFWGNLLFDIFILSFWLCISFNNLLNVDLGIFKALRIVCFLSGYRSRSRESSDSCYAVYQLLFFLINHSMLLISFNNIKFELTDEEDIWGFGWWSNIIKSSIRSSCSRFSFICSIKFLSSLIVSCINLFTSISFVSLLIILCWIFATSFISFLPLFHLVQVYPCQFQS